MNSTASRRLTLALTLTVTATLSTSCWLMDRPIPAAIDWLRARSWQVDLVGDRYEVSRPDCTDAHLADLITPEGRLGKIDLTLRETTVTDAGLLTLADHAGVLTLDVSGLPITDAGLTGLGNWRMIENLYLTDTQITDATLQRLDGLERLEILQLHGCTHLSGNGLGYVSSRELRWLGLADTTLDDTGLDRLNDKPALATVVLENTAVTAAGITALKRFDRLQEVYAHGINEPPEELDNSSAGEVIADPKGQPTHYRPRTATGR